MGEGEDLVVTRTIVNNDGETVSIETLSNEELIDLIKRCIRSGIAEEHYSKGGPDYYKNSWITYLGGNRTYFDACQVAFHKKKIKIQPIIDEAVKEEYARFSKLTPAKKLKKFKTTPPVVITTPSSLNSQWFTINPNTFIT